MKKAMPKKFKILIGVSAFVVIMAAIIWIVALALLATDIKTEVYGAEFDYVDDVMYDNAYIAGKSGRWQLYRGGDAITGAYSQLDYAGDGRFMFRSLNGRGWGFVDTAGKLIVEYDDGYERLTQRFSLVAVKKGENEFTVKNGENRTFRAEGEPLYYDDFAPFYDAYGDRYVVYKDVGGKYTAVDTKDYTTTELPFTPNDKFSCVGGFLTVERTNIFTYDNELERVAFLDGYTSAETANGYFKVVSGHAVLVKRESGSVRFTLENGKNFTVPSASAQMTLTNGKEAIVGSSGKEYVYYNGTGSLTDLHFEEAYNLTDGAAYKFSTASGGFMAFDSDCNRVSGGSIEAQELYKRKEKNKAEYTVEVKYLLADGKLYVHDEKGWTPKLENVISVQHNEEKSDSRIVTRSNSDGTQIYDSFFELKDRRTQITSGQILDPFLPAYAYNESTQEQTVVTKDGTFKVGATDYVDIVRCTDPDNYYIAASKDMQKLKLYSKNGGFICETERIINGFCSETQIVALREDCIDIVTKNRKIDVKYDDVELSENNKYALCMRGSAVTVLNLNDGSVTGEYVFAGDRENNEATRGITVVEKSVNAFVIRSNRTGLYGVISDGKLTLSPTFMYAELHDGFLIASVDEGEDAIRFQADFSGNRISGIYTELTCTEGLTMGARGNEREIMNSRGRVILKDVTFVPKDEKTNSFKFMNCWVYDEETHRTVEATRRDGSRLLVVTAGGYKRVISISHDGF